LTGGLIGVALAGCGESAHPAAPRRLASAAAQVSSVPPTTASTPKPPAPAATSALRRLQSALTSDLDRLGPQTGAFVYDIGRHTTLFALRADVMRPPASVEKLYTTVAVLTALGPEARLSTAVLGAGHLGPGGVWHGSLYLRGGGDPTFGDGGFNRVWEDGYGPTAAQLVSQLSARGIRRVTGQVIGDASLFDARRGGPNTAFRPDVPDMGGQLAALTYDHGATMGRLSPGAFAARELVLTMRGAHIRAKAAAFTAATPTNAAELASVTSPPTSTLLRLMDVPSDDFFAEMLTKQLGVRFFGTGSTRAGAQVIGSVIAALGVHPRIVDGSGLSRHDQSSPRQVVKLLDRVWRTPVGRVIDGSLPTVGVNGTVQTIGVKTAAQGRCIAKTGTLDDVTNLAGYCQSRGGHALAFALFVDGPSNWQALAGISRMVGAIASY
jgi:serine-type D-Ala-D-Ala carboxypeptidase/endopeptidase (penicillin-binding protein 4)